MPRDMVDVNSDLGERIGPLKVADDDEILAYVSSANVACMFHAGDPLTMRDVCRSAKVRGVAVGAHVSLPDPLGFGRRKMSVSADEVYAYVVYQLGALREICRHEGIELAHVKPHGALYAMMIERRDVGEAILDACARSSPRLPLIAHTGTWLVEEAYRRSIPVLREVLLDRRYGSDGMYRSGEVLSDAAAVGARMRLLLSSGRIRADDGTEVQIAFDTLCVHSDNPASLTLLKAIRSVADELRVAIGQGSEGAR